MGTQAEKLPGRGKKTWGKFLDNPGAKRALKQAVSRLRRRLEKMDPENAPVKRPTKGWAD